jgi:hypothetical protein
MSLPPSRMRHMSAKCTYVLLFIQWGTHFTPFALLHVLYNMWARCATTDQADTLNPITDTTWPVFCPALDIWTNKGLPIA